MVNQYWIICALKCCPPHLGDVLVLFKHYIRIINIGRSTLDCMFCIFLSCYENWWHAIISSTALCLLYQVEGMPENVDNSNMLCSEEEKVDEVNICVCVCVHVCMWFYDVYTVNTVMPKCFKTTFLCMHPLLSLNKGTCMHTTFFLCFVFWWKYLLNIFSLYPEPGMPVTAHQDHRGCQWGTRGRPRGGPDECCHSECTSLPANISQIWFHTYRFFSFSIRAQNGPTGTPFKLSTCNLLQVVANTWNVVWYMTHDHSFNPFLSENPNFW